MIRVGNAPCSWGTLEFEDRAAQPITFEQVLDEMTATGYEGTELGDWGFMPTEPEALRAALGARRLIMTGAFVPIAFRHRAAHEEGEARALRTARLLAAVADPGYPPFIVLSDDNTRDPARAANAGRVTPALMLDDDAWRAFAEGVNRVARAVRDQTGLRAVFHHHCAGYVETPTEINRLLEMTDPEYVGLVFDTGHYAFGSGDPSRADIPAALERYGERIWYVHLKDCDPAIAAHAAREQWDYHTAVRHGVFCELGMGCVPFQDVVKYLLARGYHGFVTVEQDVLPGMGTPRESAERNRHYLRALGI